MTAPAASASASESASWSARRTAPAGLAIAGLFQGLEICHDVGAILGLGQAGEGHLGALGKALRLVEPLVERIDVPGALVRLEPVGKGVALALGDLLADDAVEVRTDPVLAALV